MTNRNLKDGFSKMLLTARTRMDYTQEQVAEAVSITLRWYQILEKNGKLPSALVLMRLQLFFNLDLEPLRDFVGLQKPGPASSKKKRKSSDKKAVPPAP